MPTLTLYGTPDCHLCDEARAVLERVRAQRPFELIELDISEDEVLLRDYFERIPVIAIDGEDAFELFVDERRLLDRLERALQ
jgi:glutaredoxin